LGGLDNRRVEIAQSFTLNHATIWNDLIALFRSCITHAGLVGGHCVNRTRFGCFN